MAEIMDSVVVFMSGSQEHMAVLMLQWAPLHSDVSQMKAANGCARNEINCPEHPSLILEINRVMKKGVHLVSLMFFSMRIESGRGHIFFLPMCPLRRDERYRYMWAAAFGRGGEENHHHDGWSKFPKNTLKARHRIMTSQIILKIRIKCLNDSSCCFY